MLQGGSNSVVESQPSKLLVAGSIPVSRSNLRSSSPRARELRLASQGEGKQTHGRLVGRSAGTKSGAWSLPAEAMSEGSA